MDSEVHSRAGARIESGRCSGELICFVLRRMWRSAG
jgi:hypothetical protein